MRGEPWSVISSPRAAAPRFFREEVLGLPLLRGQLPRRGDPARWERKGLRFFLRAGVHCLLNGPENAALPLTETGTLYRRKAADIALLELERRGVPPETAVVGLWASHASRELEAACRALAGQVRALALELPERETMSWELQQDCGIPVFRGEGVVTLCFTPAPPGEGRLLLGERRPQAPGVTFSAPGVEPPPGCQETPLLALLGETGRLGWEQIQVQISQEEPP
ncbi:MAG: hypothetical protein LUC35_08340 [Clostridiales bacterium]|nr:hypothetical protein [Clostridiales bacterium]